MSRIITPGTVVNPLDNPMRPIKKSELQSQFVGLSFPTRLVPVALDPRKLALAGDGTASAGEILVSIDSPIRVQARFLGNNNGTVKIGDASRKDDMLIQHVYGIMCELLRTSPSLMIDVDGSAVPKHSGFGSNGAKIGAIAAAINELYGRPIADNDLIKYCVTNYVEQMKDGSLMQNTCVGGSVATGLSEGGIMVVAGRGTPIGKANYQGHAIVGRPDRESMSSEDMTQWEHENFAKEKPDADAFAHQLDYNMLHEGLPGLAQNDIRPIARIAADYGTSDSAHPIAFAGARERYREMLPHLQGASDMSGTTSVSDTYFALTNNPEKEDRVMEVFQSHKLKTSKVPVCNTTYTVTDREGLE